MSFGFSVGDFIAVGNLIKNIASCLKDTGGASAEYQELLRELECLQQALQHLDKLQNRSSSSTNLDSIKYAALSCRRPLEQFLEKIRKYNKSLGVWEKNSILKSTADKLRWGIGEKEEVRKLQSYLNIHVGTISILLAEHGLEKMNIASDKAAAHQLHVRERLEHTRDIVHKISGNLAVQALAVENTQTMLARLYEMVSGEFRSSWRSLGEMVVKVFVSTQQIHAVLLEMKGSLAKPDTRWSFFQAPLVVEDALGMKFPVPSEYDFDLLEAVIKQRFKTGPGALEVKAGNYEYFKTKNSNEVISGATRLFPGTAITMAIIVVQPTSVDEICPMPGCGSTETTEPPGGGRTCCKCNVWFSPTEKTRRSLHNLLFAVSTLSNSPANDDQHIETGGANKRAKIAPVDDVGLFRNIRLSHDEHPVEFLEPPNPPDISAWDRDNVLGFYDPPAHRREESSILVAKSPVDIDDALSYLKKVQNRFASQSDTYRQFRETLRTYQRESTRLQDVYVQITNLFNSAPDLVEGFKQFLPETFLSHAEVQAAQTKPAGTGMGRVRKRQRDEGHDLENDMD